jgi:hypothetical protein
MAPVAVEETIVIVGAVFPNKGTASLERSGEK